MDKLASQLANLEPFKFEHRIIQQVVAQIKKDFDDIVIDLELNAVETPYQQLKAYLKPIIEYLLDERPERLFTLFYRIDISEQTVKSLMGNADIDLAEEYTELILNRELQKVIIRNFYSA